MRFVAGHWEAISSECGFTLGKQQRALSRSSFIVSEQLLWGCAGGLERPAGGGIASYLLAFSTHSHSSCLSATLAAYPSNQRTLPPITTDTGRDGGEGGECERVKGGGGRRLVRYQHPMQQT